MKESSKKNTETIPKQEKVSDPEQFIGVNNDHEINLLEIGKIIWAGKKIILSIGTIFFVIAVIYGNSLPDIYKSTTLLIATSNTDKMGISALNGQFGGLAAMAGLDLDGAGADKTKIAIAMMKSRSFLAGVVEKYNLKPIYLAATSWDAHSHEIIFDKKIYDKENNKWDWKTESKWKKGNVPSSQEAVDSLIKSINISKNKKTGVVTLSVVHVSPFVAKQMVERLVSEINESMRQSDIVDATRSIDYLNLKLEETSVAEMKRIFYELIEAQTRTKMLAEVRDQYVFRTIDPPSIPENKEKPNRLLIVILISLFGGLVGVFFVLLKGLFE